MSAKFIHLHTHSHYSLLNALPKIPELVKEAKKYGMEALALTDNGNMYGAIEFYKECKKHEIKPVLGVDFYVSATNSYILNTAKKYKNKIILPYNIYKRGFWHDNPSPPTKLDIKDTEVMIAMTPIIRKTKEELDLLTDYALRPIWKKGEVSKVVDDVEYFTYESFNEFIEMLEQDGINHLLINSVPAEEVHVIVPFIKQYVELKETYKIKEKIL